jgi:carbon monoxide dehydrogenase subunit G
MSAILGKGGPGVELRGEETIAAPLEQVWRALNDPQLMARCIPGVKSLEPLGEDEFMGLVEVSIGPIKGTFQGRLRICQREPPRRLRLQMQGQGRAGGLQGEGVIELEGDGDITKVSYTGDVHLTGLLASLGARVLHGASQILARQFFANLARELETQP